MTRTKILTILLVIATGLTVTPAFAVLSATQTQINQWDNEVEDGFGDFIEDVISDVNTNITNIAINITNITNLQIDFDALEIRVGINEDDIDALQIDLDIAEATQISEQMEQDGIQTDVVNLQGNVTAIQTQIGGYPATLAYNLLPDSNDPLCEPDQTVTQVSNGWCPTGNIAEFEITDGLVTTASLIVINLTGDGTGCGVTDTSSGSFNITCSSNVADGAQLTYMVVQ